jgi:hypothetical protein
MITNSIRFFGNEPNIEVLRLSKDGIWANPDIPADEAATAVLKALHYNVKVLVEAAVEEERKKAQGEIDTLYEMYKLVCSQRDELMDQQRAQIAALRGRIQ